MPNLATATKGWCNLGFTGCPSISDIITGMNSNGVKTNLDTMTDYSRVSGLYFQKSEHGNKPTERFESFSFSYMARNIKRYYQAWELHQQKLTFKEIGKMALVTKS